MSWVLFAVAAAFFQSWRNAYQKKLSEQVDVWTVTASRFLFAAPIVSIYCGLMWFHQAAPETVEWASPKIAFGIVLASVCQILATACMVVLFQARNYAVGVGLAKSEAFLVAFLGALFFSEPLSTLAWLGIVLGSIAVWLFSFERSAGVHKEGGSVFSLKVLVFGLLSGLFFALTTLWFRHVSLILQAQGVSALLAAAWVLTCVLWCQLLLLMIYLGYKHPLAFSEFIRHKGIIVWISAFGAVGSICWLSAFSLQNAAMVKTVGQVEVFFTLMISGFWFKERLSRREMIGFVLVALGVIVVVLGA